MPMTSRLPGFYKLSSAERFKKIIEASGLAENELNAFTPSDEKVLTTADNMIENVIGAFSLPVGVGTNFTINGQDYLVPMVTEEPSVVAAASNAASIARVRGGFYTSSTKPLMIAQIQIVGAVDPYGARMRLLERRQDILNFASAQDPFLVKLGGGAEDIEVRVIDGPDTAYVVLHLIVDVRDAMGANTVNAMAEALEPMVCEITRANVRLRILTNKADLRLARARAVFDKDALGGEQVADGVIDAYNFAVADPYRAATNNKGIMNGVSAVVLATGNDTRAVESGAHSHAIAEGRYTSLSHYEKDKDGNVVGTLEMPMAVGLIGGATKTHPAAQAAIKLLGVESARELAEVIVAVGLSQNLAALRALGSEGIQKGHMNLHARNIAIAAGAEGDEIELVTAELRHGQVRLDHAERILNRLREQGK